MMGDFLPFGAQYYRAPTPLEEDWEKDLAAMSGCGFNLIKIWAVWRSNNPSDGVYRFDDLQRLMNLAEKYKIKVIINTIFDAAPSWFYKKYPDSLMITADGRKLKPSTTAFRQSGGFPGPCLHHSEGISIRKEFLEAVSDRFSNHPALYAWDVWNEPSLGGGRGSDMVCFCDNSFSEFILWLKEKYGDINGLNSAWHTYYQSFDEVEPPVCKDAFQNMIDWRYFFSDAITKETRMRVQAIKRFDLVHPVMVHTVPLPYFTMVSNCGDDYRLAKECDWYGNSLGSSELAAVISKTAAKGKKVISSEIHAIGGTTFGRPNIPTFEQMKRHIFIPLSKGIQGFCFWQYRPERMGREAPAWGLTNLDGSVSLWMEMAMKINNGLQRYKDIILKSRPEKSEIAVVNCPKQQLFCFCADDTIDKYYKAVKGIFDGFYSQNYCVDIISPDQLADGDAKNYKLIYYPMPYYMEQKTADMLKNWTAQGGTLVCDAFFGAYKAENGLHETTIPGMDFDEVFGVTEARVMTASQFHDAYSRQWSRTSDEQTIEMRLSADFGRMKKDSIVRGHYFSEGFVPKTAEPIAEFSDGICAAAINRYYDGRAIIIGSLLGNSDCAENRAFLSELAELACIRRSASADAENIRIDSLSDKIIVVCNENDTTVECRISAKGSALVNIITGDTSDICGEKAKIKLEAYGCECYAVI